VASYIAIDLSFNTTETMTMDNVITFTTTPKDCTLETKGACTCTADIDHHKADADALAHVRTLVAWEAWACQPRPDLLERLRIADHVLRELAAHNVEEWNTGVPDAMKLPTPPEHVVVVPDHETDGDGPRAA
jgi:hypothetical protein